MNPEDFRKALEQEDIPPHRPGFWDDLSNEIGASPMKQPRQGWLVALQAAAVVVIIAGVAALAIRDNPSTPTDLAGVTTSTVAQLTSETGRPETQAQVADTSEDAPATTEAVDHTATTSQPRTSTSEVAGPWSRSKLSQADVPAVLVEQWNRSENHLWCSALYPTSLGGIVGATIRPADFAGGWAVAWDLPGRRSAFGVAGVGLPAWDDIAVRMPSVVPYSDGIVGYGGEGFDDEATQRMAEFAVPGQLCGYQVWSKLGDQHLLDLVESLRLVEGLEAEPVDGGVAPEEATLLSPVPWAEAPVVYPDSWPVLPPDVTAFIPTVGIPEAAVVRAANIGDWALTWDASSGPGHDSENYPCGDCGRGVIGVSVGRSTETPTVADFIWDDGSVGILLPRVGSPDVPLDRLLVRAPGSVELLPGAPRLDIHLGGSDLVVSVWSHLGTDSLLDLVSGLRRVDSTG